MSQTINDVLGGQNLTGLIQGVKSGLSHQLPAGFLSITRNVEGDSATYRRVDGTRQTARLAAYGSPSQRRSASGITEVPVKLLHSHEHVIHPSSVLENLQRFDSPNHQQLGRDEVARQTQSFRRLFENLRVASVCSMLGSGKIWFDGEGNLLPGSSGASVTVDYGIPDDHKNQIGGIIDAGWDAADTDIIGQIIALKAKAARDTGYPIRHAFYGRNIPGYIAANNDAKSLITGNPALAHAMASTGDVPGGFLDMQWHPAYDAFYLDANGDVQNFFGDDTIVFTPEPSADWYEMLQGSYAIPTGVAGLNQNDAQGDDAVAALSSLSSAYGLFSYSVLMTDPVAIKQVSGDTFLPTLKVPSAVFIADVTP